MNVNEFEELLGSARREHPKWFLLESDPPAATGSIEEVQRRLGVRLPEEYRFFLENYGGGQFAFATVFSVHPGSAWNIEAQNASIPRAMHREDFVAVADNGVGDYYGFKTQNGMCERAIWFADHEELAIKPTRFADFFEFIVEKALKPA